MTDIARNKQLAVDFWTAPVGDKARYLTEDVRWHLPISAARRGRAEHLQGDEVRALLLGSSTFYEAERTSDIWHVVAEGDLVALHCTMHARTQSGKDYHGPYFTLFRIEDGLIAEAWAFTDTAHAMEMTQ